MNRRLLRGFIACFTFLYPVYMTSAQEGADVWATVNGHEIKEDQVERYYRSRLTPDRGHGSHVEALALKLEILDELINSEILVERAAKMNLVASDAEVEDKFTETKNAYTEEEFQKMLKDTGLTVDELKSDIRLQLSMQKLLNHEVVAKISITDQDVSDFYKQNRAQFNVTEPQYHMAHISITSRPDPTVRNRKHDKALTDAEAKRKAALLEQKLKAGADFAQLAMDYSEDSSAASGGDTGFSPESALTHYDPLVQNAVHSLKVGEVSEPIVIQDRIFILKLIAKEPVGQRDLSDPQVQQAIRDTLRTDKEKNLRTAYIATLRSQAQVTYYKKPSSQVPAASTNSEPTLSETLQFIQEKLNGLGKVSFVVVTQDAVQGTKVSTVLTEIASNIKLGVPTCTINYHWATTRHGQSLLDQNIQFSFKAIAKIEIMPLQEALNRTNVAEGHPELTVQSTNPQLWTLLVTRSDFPKQFSHFSFDDQKLADRVAKAMTHAAEMCGAGEDNEPF